MRTTVSRWACVAAVSAAFIAVSLSGCYSGGGWSMPRLSNLNPRNWGTSTAGSSLAQSDSYPPSPNINIPPSQPNGQIAGGSSYGAPYDAANGGGQPYPDTPYGGAPGYPNQTASAFENAPPPSHSGGGAQNGFYTADQRNAGNYNTPPSGYNPAPPSGGGSGYGAPYTPGGGATPNNYSPPAGYNASPPPSNGGYGGYQSEPSGSQDMNQGYQGNTSGGYDSGYGATPYDAGGSSGYDDGGAYGGGSGAYVPSGGAQPPPGFGSKTDGAAMNSYAANESDGANLTMPNNLLKRGGSYAPGSVGSTQLASAASGSPTTFSRTESGDSPASLPNSSVYGGGGQPGFSLPNQY
ncbi:MAG: hypothetical protein RIC55_30450 [Pirellulaceae bacterium]